MWASLRIFVEKIGTMENVFRDYGSFENKNNDRIICFNVSRTYLQCERIFNAKDPIYMNVQESIGDYVANEHKMQILLLLYVRDIS